MTNELSKKDLQSLDALLKPGAIYRLSVFTPEGKQLEQLKRKTTDMLSDVLVKGDLSRGESDLLAGFLVEGIVNIFVKHFQSEALPPDITTEEISAEDMDSFVGSIRPGAIHVLPKVNMNQKGETIIVSKRECK